jgi:catechol 2,3-dioxygenase-like lactoylglutathione lyase family enzyme
MLVGCLPLSCQRCRPKDGTSTPEKKIPAPPETLLGAERGLDHIGVAVRDLEAARRSFAALGFVHPVAGRLPNGVQNVNYYFEDTSYLETLNHYDAAKAPWLARFLEKHEGARFLVLAVEDIDGTATFLRRRGFETNPPSPGTIQVAGAKTQAPTEMWRTLFFKVSPVPADSLFFISYNAKQRNEVQVKLRDPKIRRRLHHPNTAVGIRAAWIAVPDAEAVARVYERIGLRLGPSFTDQMWGARGREVIAGQGSILVVQPVDPKGGVATFIKKRGGGIIGVTISVAKIEVARRRIEERIGRTFPAYKGHFGDSILITPELTHGVWLELAQR